VEGSDVPLTCPVGCAIGEFLCSRQTDTRPMLQNVRSPAVSLHPRAVWPEFLDDCREHLSTQFEDGFGTDPNDPTEVHDVDDYQAFSNMCLSVDGLALVEYAIQLKDRGCTIDLGTVDGDGAPPGGNIFGGGRRQMQIGYFQQWLDGSNHCTWDELDNCPDPLGAFKPP
jgi:hypothetical protein